MGQMKITFSVKFAMDFHGPQGLNTNVFPNPVQISIFKKDVCPNLQNVKVVGLGYS